MRVHTSYTSMSKTWIEDGDTKVEDHGTGTKSNLLGYSDVDDGAAFSTNMKMWDELIESVEAKQGKLLKTCDDLVDLMFHNLEEYAVTGAVASGEIPFAVHFSSPGWLPGASPKEIIALRAFFCRVDEGKEEGSKLVLTKPELFGMIYTNHGRAEFVKILKDELGWSGRSSLVWPGVLGSSNFITCDDDIADSDEDEEDDDEEDEDD